MPHLPDNYPPITSETSEFKFEHGGSRKGCTVQQKRMPVEPGFSTAAYKAQGLTIDQVIVDPAGCAGTGTTICGVFEGDPFGGFVRLAQL